MTYIRRWATALTVGLQAKEAHLPFYLFCLVFGFLGGNLFGTCLALLRHYISSDIFIILLLCALFEYISALVYVKPPQGAGRVRPVRRAANFIKIGCLLGFFIDAFKVGS